jgi:hypothetical protein
MMPNNIAAHDRAHSRFESARAAGCLPPLADNYPLLGFSNIFAGIGVFGLRLTEQAKRLQGSPVVIRGYMAPPLSEHGKHFVLTRAPLHSCPFCDDGARWPDDAIPAYLDNDSHFVEPSRRIQVAGELKILSATESEQHALRIVRLVNARWQSL